MVRKLAKYGDKLVLELDESMLQQLNWDETSEIEVAIGPGRSLTIESKDNEARSPQLKSILDEVNRDFGAALRKLAE